MKHQINALGAGLLFGISLALTSAAAVPAPGQLLTADTLAVFTIPDYAQAEKEGEHWPMSLLWKDPAMKPFVDKFTGKLQSDLIAPLEKEFGIRFKDYCGLAQGQVTLAITRNGWGIEPDREPAFLFLMDAREQSDTLKAKLAELKTKWRDSGKRMKTETIRNLEFTTLIFSSDDVAAVLNQAFPDPNEGYETLKPPKPKKPAKQVEVIIGQSESLLILGNSASEIEKVLIRQSGGTVAGLADQKNFARRQSSHFRNSMAYGWINLQTIFKTLIQQAAAKAEADPNVTANSPRGDRIMGALGLLSMESLGYSVRGNPEGAEVSLFLDSPENRRKGLTKLLTFETKDAAPPAFVPAEAVRFSRWRLDLQKVFSTLESTLVEAAPQFASLIKLVVDNAGKDKDPNFDLRQNLIANLGDDIISFEKTPRGRTIQDLNSPPSIALISSPRSDQLAASIKAVAGLLPQKNMRVKEREFLGRTVYSINLPATTPPGGNKPVSRSVNFAASGGYVAVSTDEAMLEEYLRSSSGSGKSLKDTPNLAATADKVGGMRTGLFGYEDQRETGRVLFEVLKQESGTIAGLLSLTPLAGRLGIDEDEDKFKDWLDFSLLPSFDRIEKYFGISVWSGSVDAEGMSIKLFAPHPPGLR